MLRIKGFERKQGVFDVGDKSINYDNVILHINNDDCPIENFIGVSCEQIKIKCSDIPKIFCKKYEELSSMLDVPLEFKYSLKNGKPELSGVVILDVDDKETSFKFNN